MIDVPSEFISIETVEGSYCVTEEWALTVIAQIKRGDTLLEFETHSKMRVWLPPKQVTAICDSSPEIRDFARSVDAMYKTERRDQGHIE